MPAFPLYRSCPRTASWDTSDAATEPRPIHALAPARRIAASAISSLWTAGPLTASHAIVWFPPIDWIAFAATLALACLGALAARIRRLPAGTLMVPLVIGVVLEAIGVLRIELPPWLLAVTYAVIGWSIGLRFTRPILAHAARALPAVAASIVGLIAICGGLAAILVVAAGIDPLTAYLATSPGGVDSVAIIAARTAGFSVKGTLVKVALPPVLAFHAARPIASAFSE